MHTYIQSQLSVPMWSAGHDSTVFVPLKTKMQCVSLTSSLPLPSALLSRGSGHGAFWVMAPLEFQAYYPKHLQLRTALDCSCPGLHKGYH